MSFRNNTEAENYRLKAELEEKEKALKEATAKLNKLERDEELDDLEKNLFKESWFSRKLRERQEKKDQREAEKLRRQGTMRYRGPRHSWIDSFDLQGSLTGLLILAVFALVIVAICNSIFHYFNDFQSGTVVERERIPGHMSCTTDSKGRSDCDWVPESFHITIQNEQGETATWAVDSGEYHSVDHGDYFCYTDLFHDADGCTPPTLNQRGFH